MAEIHRASYPFVRSTFTEYDEEGGYEVPTWKPGVEYAERRDPRASRSEYPHEFEALSVAVADAVGEIILTVISRHKPGPKYPERIFYTRQWRDPDGKVFGSKKLHICSAQAFNRRKRGWFIDEPYELRVNTQSLGDFPHPNQRQATPASDPSPPNPSLAGTNIQAERGGDA